MRGSDVVDLVVEILPRWVVQVLLFGLFGFMYVTDWHAPIHWYINDKAQGVMELLVPVFTAVITPG